MEPSIYLDLDNRLEIERRQRIAFGGSLTNATVEKNAVSPNYNHPQWRSADARFHHFCVVVLLILAQ